MWQYFYKPNAFPFLSSDQQLKVKTSNTQMKTADSKPETLHYTRDDAQA